ncbi:hypothetical protein Z043_107724, partial [Scleropages formosus]
SDPVLLISENAAIISLFQSNCRVSTLPLWHTSGWAQGSGCRFDESEKLNSPDNRGRQAVAAATMTTQQMQMEQMGQFRITVWEEENFQGKRCDFVGFEYPEYQGQQFILEKGDYPRYEAWSGNSGYRTEHLLSFRPIKCADTLRTIEYTNIGFVFIDKDIKIIQLPQQNHSDSKVTLYECNDLQGRKFEICDDYPSLQAMGWCSKEVPSIKVNSGAWVAYQFPGYRGYQYILERDRREGEYRNYNEYSTQAHTHQIQSIRRIQQ